MRQSVLGTCLYFGHSETFVLIINAPYDEHCLAISLHESKSIDSNHHCVLSGSCSRAHARYNVVLETLLASLLWETPPRPVAVCPGLHPSCLRTMWMIMPQAHDDGWWHAMWHGRWLQPFFCWEIKGAKIKCILRFFNSQKATWEIKGAKIKCFFIFQ